MPSHPSPRSGFTGAALFAALLGGAVVILPLLFGQKITVSPLLLFAAAVIPNFIVYLIPATDKNGGQALYSRVFFLRVIGSVAAAFLLLAIYRIAYTIGAG